MTTYPSFTGLRHDEIDRAFQHIAEAMYLGESDFLFGAGMSVDSNLPSGHALARRLLDKFFPPASSRRPPDEEIDQLLDVYPFEAIVQAVEHGLNGRAKLTGALREVLSVTSTPNEAHRLFHQLCMWDGSPRLHRVFTTNFDDLLERQFDAGGESVTEHNVKKLKAVTESGKIAIIHVHGTLGDGYQITEQDVLDDRFRIVANELRAALITSDAFVFVGYSMSDPDFRRLYQLYRADIADRGQAGKKTYVVMPATDTSYRFGSVLWETRGATWIPMGAVDFFLNLRRFFEGHVEDEVRRDISSKYGLKDRAAFDDLVARTAELLHVEEPDAVQFLLEARPRAGA